LPRGLPASYIKKAKRELGKGASWHDIFKRAWELYKGSKVYKAVSGNPTKKKGSRKKSSKKRSVSRMAKKKRRYSRSLTIPLAPIAGLVAGLATPPPGRESVITNILQGDWKNAFTALAINYTGVDPNTGKFDFNNLTRGLFPLVAGLLVHKFVGGSPLNLNRMLARHKIPLIRI